MTYHPRQPIVCARCAKRPAIGRKLCRSCYVTLWRKGGLGEFPVLTPEDIFLSRIEKTDTCWIWKGGKNGYGYGILILPGEKKVRAHRYSYEWFKGAIPDGLVIMHTCDNPICVNPDHLVAATKGDNNRDCTTKGRRPKGMAHWNTRLSPEMVEAIRNSHASTSAVAAEFGVNYSHAWRIRKGVHRAKG